MTGNEFKQHRINRGLNQRQWASMLGVSYSSVTKWETKPNEKVPRYIGQQVEAMRVDKITIKNLSPEQQEKLSRRAAEAGKTVDDYVADLLKAILFAALLVGAFLYSK